MPSKAPIIGTVDLFEKQITISFLGEWYQEDIAELNQLILSKIPEHTLREKIIGADRENLRFAWQGNEFLLNFDYYSQSCWIYANDEPSKIAIPKLKELLAISQGNRQ